MKKTRFGLFAVLLMAMVATVAVAWQTVPIDQLFTGDVVFKQKVDLSGAKLQGASPIVLEGATGNAYQTTIAVTDPTAARTITIPNLSGTLLLTPSSTVMALTTPVLTAGSGTGLTVNDVGSVRTQVYKVTLDKTAFTAASVSNDVTIATLPAKTIVHSVVADVTTPFACTSVCTTGTLSAKLGVAANGTEFLASFDLDAAAATFGDADAEVGSALNAAAATNGGYISWAGTTVVMRATSGTGNWGSGTVTNLSAGSVTFYILYSILP